MAESPGAMGDAIGTEAPAVVGGLTPEQEEDMAALPGQHSLEERQRYGHSHGQQQGDGLLSRQPEQADQPLLDGRQKPNPSSTSDPATTSSVASPGAPSPLPSSFPKKRRGRPPGRPNTTVRDADYEDNPLVQAWNSSKTDRAVPVISIRIRDALTEQSLVHETQRNIFRMPSRETILFVQGWITAKHIASQRPSYVNGLLIHSRGQDAAVSCVQCAEKRAKGALGPFLTCRVLPGSYHNSCSNCKWFDNTSACSLYTGPKPNRKRKAKEQLAPPPAPTAAGVGPPPKTEKLGGEDPGVLTTADEGQEDPPLDPRLRDEPVVSPLQEPPAAVPPPPLPPQQKLQPEADMAPVSLDNGTGEDGQAPTAHSSSSSSSSTSSTTGGGDPSAHPDLHHGSESAEDGDAE
ncbi:hypothetical protein MYCTH_2311782 [Thermothelomyces thermophilus ATCC 42464]|uniref:Uncharacterized protein n=1 Tax=Thermothelomyces thermophilus (strain ATCC 42464 / BCRC 31852 / DSM 1799) TaxID=573729 RepID=G2QPM2_THET4|nr:uncharacterized protein MYCTH_2311782 [Thermothelomyces thermophilus ATCC 42464]AEO61535.1 hypothetical protein MYCTH_2311782 [Thermothelomyces thermophilus ATCC 42464]